jgi:hypothetical protein
MWKPHNNKAWFSIVVAMLVTAFLIVLSMWVLDLILGDRKITRVVYNSISTYAGAEWSLELALLKIKNHREGFKDEIVLDDTNSWLLGKNGTAGKMEQKIAYTMDTRSNSYSGSAKEGEFVIIPLYYDDEIWITHNENSAMKKTELLKVDWIDWNVVWNIIGNINSWIHEGDTLWLVGKWPIQEDTMWDQKIIDNNVCDSDGNCEIKYSSWSVSDFIRDHSDNYLILFSDAPFHYEIKSGKDASGNDTFFSLPKISVVATSQIGDFMQNISFTEDKSRLFDALKYSVFTEDTTPAP